MRLFKFTDHNPICGNRVLIYRNKQIEVLDFEEQNFASQEDLVWYLEQYGKPNGETFICEATGNELMIISYDELTDREKFYLYAYVEAFVQGSGGLIGFLN